MHAATIHAASPADAPMSTEAAPAVLEAADRAAARIAPLWPLKTFVAVNPFLGLAAWRFEAAAHLMHRVAGARMTLPRRHYLDAIDAGVITAADLAAARAEAPAGPILPHDVPALVEAARHGLPAPEDMIPTVADVAARATGHDWPGFVVERVSAACADFFDEGQASWPAPARENGLYACWRQAAAVDRTPEIAGLRGARVLVRSLPETPDALLVEAVGRLGLGEADLVMRFHRLLMTVGGWAAYARYKVWQAELHGGTETVLRELLAVRLAWELVLWEALKANPAVRRAWEAAALPRTDAAADDARLPEAIALDCVLQAALEKARQRALVARFADRAEAHPEATARTRPAVQAAFCIDVRSEVFRRALEGVAPAVETIGFAGFFGFPIEYVPLGHAHGGAQCPVLLTPKVTVREQVEGADAAEEARILGLRMLRRRAGKAWKAFKLAAVSSFVFVETMGLTYLAKLTSDGLGLSRPVPHPAEEGLDKAVRARLGPALEPADLHGRPTGFPEEGRVDMAEAVLTAMSLTGGFARLVVLAGHGSTTVNNPHAAGLDCGACGGHTGEANARVAAAILNDPAVRRGLAGRGIVIPEDTHFLGALHDTTTDTVTLFGAESLPPGHAEDLRRLQGWLDEAGRRARAERAARLHLEQGKPVDAQILARSADWAQVRPEWGLAGCSAFIAAPRVRTRGLDLGGRAFLHSYDWRQDAGFGTLELIMTAPMVVASWISLQYYGSAVDNRTFGSGNKVLHNVVGTIGVLEGNGGDLRTGLPLQSVHDGERLVHEPLRLSVVIEAPRDAMTAVIGKHPMVRELVDNGWLYLFQLDDTGRIAGRYAGGLAWEDVAAPVPADPEAGAVAA